jgi:ADP-ribose diphosphatase
VIVVPLTADGQALLAVERAAAFDREALGLVGGEAEEGELLAETANRELQEELGWRAGRIDFLGELHPFKYLTSRQFAFLARDLASSKLEGDEIYPVGCGRYPWKISSTWSSAANRKTRWQSPPSSWPNAFWRRGHERREQVRRV